MPANHELSAIDRFFNRLMGRLVGLGWAPGYMWLLETRGRKSGRVYTTPVNLIEHAGKTWLVAPRGRTQWTKNVEASGELVLRRGSKREQYKARTAQGSECAPVVKKYLEAYPSQVQRFFSVKPSDPLEAFEKIAQQHPAYELARPA